MDVPEPRPGPGQVLVRVAACALCRTDLHVFDDELPDPKLPLILGHEIVGRVVALGAGVTGLSVGERVGIPWLAWTCGECGFCRAGQENLCERARFTGYTSDGGYAEFTVADARFCFPLAEGIDDVSAAPLLCAGLIGYGALRKAGEARTLDIYGFGAAAHLMTQVARHQWRAVFAFTRPGDTAAQQFARRLGASWAGGADEKAPERTLCSVANLTRRDGEEFLQLAPKIPICTETQAFPLDEANEALARLREGRLQGAAVLAP